MKLLIVMGFLIVILGAVIVFRGVTYPSERSVVKVGDFQASVEVHHAIPAWVGGIAIVGGVVLVVMGFRRGHLS